MARSFMLTGTTEQKFDKIERVLPRIMRRMGTKTFGVIPASIANTYTHEVDETGMIFKCAVFAGRVKKVLFNIDSIIGKGKPKYILRIGNALGEQKVIIETKKKTHVMEVNKEIKDGDIVSLQFISEKNADGKSLVEIKDIFISVLIQLKQDLNEVKEVLTSELEKDISKEETNEGI